MWVDETAQERNARINTTFFDEPVDQSPSSTYGPDLPIRHRTRPARHAPNLQHPAETHNTSSPRDDSDVFDTALLRQEEAAQDAADDAKSIQTVIIHSDAILLESAMEVNTSSTVPSSDTEAAAKATTTFRVEQIVRKVEAGRNQLAAQNKAMMDSLRTASHQTTEYRQYIEQLRRNNYRQEQKLEYIIQDLQAEIDEQNHQMEQMRQLIAYKEGIEEELKATIEAMAGDGFKVLTGDEAVEELRSIQS